MPPYFPDTLPAGEFSPQTIWRQVGFWKFG
jgi:hypothetical protein